MSGPAWIYDGSEIADPFGYGERAMVFLKLLKHPKSRAPDRALTIDPWQDRIVRRIYGPCGENGRRITRVVVSLPQAEVTVSDTEKLPLAVKRWLGLGVVSSGEPSPKSHDHAPGAPALASWN